MIRDSRRRYREEEAVEQNQVEGFRRPRRTSLELKWGSDIAWGEGNKSAVVTGRSFSDGLSCCLPATETH